MPTTHVDLNKKEETKKVDGVNKPEEKKILPTKRQIVIETDGNQAVIVKAEVAGNFELLGILQGLINAINKQ